MQIPPPHSFFDSITDCRHRLHFTMKNEKNEFICGGRFYFTNLVLSLCLHCFTKAFINANDWSLGSEAKQKASGERKKEGGGDKSPAEKRKERTPSDHCSTENGPRKRMDKCQTK